MPAPNRIRDELGHGLEMLRAQEHVFMHESATAASMTYVYGPFDVDVDIRSIRITAGLVPADDNTNNIIVYNGTVAGNVQIATRDIHANALTAQVPVTVTPTANQRVAAGTPVTVVVVMAGNDAAASASVTVRLNYEIPIGTYNPGNNTTYGGYSASFPD